MGRRWPAISSVHAWAMSWTHSPGRDLRRARARRPPSSSPWRPASWAWSPARRKDTGRRRGAPSARRRPFVPAPRRLPRPTRPRTPRPSPLSATASNSKLQAALEHAAEIPIRIAEAGTDVTALAALLVENGNPEVRADAAAAAALAEGGTRAAAKLVQINLGATEDDPRIRHVSALVAAAAEASERALAAA